MLIRSVDRNDGDAPILVTFAGRHRERLLHAGIAASLGKALKHSVAVVIEGSETFDAIAAAFPPVPSRLAVAVPAEQSEMI